ncbi:unnamed protein product [Rhizoctonia solani]|uniref:Uncharacterized protein n=1 Tax=Rhizoctonia solani TaxID=456999 RepID=A0A8H3ALS0_9AGAM|nr:unnamed protein product [Rhizoctonia solani]
MRYRGQRVDCYCGLAKYGEIPHKVAMRTRYCHMAEAEAAEVAGATDNEQEAEQEAEGQQMEVNSNQDTEMQDVVSSPPPVGGDTGPPDNDIYERGSNAHSDYGPSEPLDAGEDWDILRSPPGSPPPPPRNPTPPYSPTRR